MATNEFSLIGDFATVIDRLHIFSEQMQKKGARAAARKAMIPVRDDARRRAFQIDDEKTRSRIFQNIVINESARGGKRVGGIVMRVGVRGGALSKVERTLAGGVGKRSTGQVVKRFKATKNEITHPGGDTRHWRFVELGYRTRDGRAVPARPFMRPALSENIGEVIDTLATELEAQMDKLAHYAVSAHP